MKAHRARQNASASAPGFNELLNHLQLVGDGVVALKDGALLAGLWFEGRDLECAASSELAELRQTVEEALRCLDGNWMLHVDAFRREEDAYIEGTFAEATDALIDEELAQRARYFRTYTALFVTWLPPRLIHSQAGQQLLTWLGGNEPQHAAGALSALNAQKAHFETVLAELQGRLAREVALRRMRSKPDNCELCQALNYQINGVWRPCRPPPRGMYLDSYFAHDFFDQGDHLIYAGGRIAVVSVVGYPGDGTAVGMLSELNALPFELRWSNRYIVLGYFASKSFLGRVQKAWRRVQRGFFAQLMQDPGAHVSGDAVKRVREVDVAQDGVDSHTEFYGHHSCTVTLRGETKEAVLANAKRVVDTFQAAGFTARIENDNAVEAWLGSLGGHGYENLRKPGITLVNYADVLPLHREWTGEATSPNPFLPAGSPPLMQVRSRSGDAHHFNLHVDDVGHTLVLGPTGAGKSTLLALLASQFGRYPDSQVFAFDFGCSLLPLALARKDGIHYALGEDGGPQLAPLADLDTPQARAFASEWLRVLFDEQGLKLLPEQGAELDQAVEDLAATTRRASDRTLTALMAFLQDVPMRDAMRFYTSGPGARVLNGEEDALRFRRFTVFEIAALMKMKTAVSTPALLYLFHEVEKRLQAGRVTLLILDEAWLALAHSVFGPRLGEWLVSLRKLNCCVVLATQELAQVMDSPIRGPVMQGCQTRILLANRDATSQTMRELYVKLLQLSSEQISLIAKARRKREFYLTAHGRSRMCSVDLGPIGRSFLGAGGARDLKRIRALYGEHGPGWEARWLEERDLAAAAARWRQHRRRQGHTEAAA